VRLLPHLLAIVILLVPPAGAAPDPAVPREGRTLDGRLLVAAPGMSDPRFQQTVILLVRHGADGAFGIVINRPIGQQPLAELLAAAGLPTDGIEDSIRIFYGGPVQPEVGFVLHTPDYDGRSTLAIDHHLAMTADPEILRAIGQHKGPAKSLFAMGYAGWAPGQLEAELARGDWSLASGDPALVFDADRASLWDRAMARREKDI